MEIGPINAQIAQAVAALKSATPAKAAQSLDATKATQTPGAVQGDFIASLDAALRSVSNNDNAATELQRQFQLENPNVSLEETMIAMSKSQIGFQAAVQVRNKLVQAYEQIMQMPV